MFTFKKVPREGKYRSFERRITLIKLNKKEVGSISENRYRSADEKWGISFMIKKEITKEDPANFKWIFFKNKFPTEEEARNFVNKKYEKIISQFDLYQRED